MNIANFTMILFMFTATLFPKLPTNWRIILTSIGFLGALLVGYLDIKFKIINEEQNYMVSKNDVVMKYAREIEENNKMLKEMNKINLNKRNY